MLRRHRIAFPTLRVHTDPPRAGFVMRGALVAACGGNNPVE
jgi:hypothetical protein